MRGCGTGWCFNPHEFDLDTADGSMRHTHHSARMSGDSGMATWLQGDHIAGPDGVDAEGPGLVIDRDEVWGGAESTVIPPEEALELLRDSAELLEKVRPGAIEHLIGQLTQLRDLLDADKVA